MSTAGAIAYTQEQIDQIIAFLSIGDDNGIQVRRGLLKAVLSKRTGESKWRKQPEAHWDVKKTEQKQKASGLSKWLLMPPLNDAAIHAHIIHPNRLLGIVPAYIGCCVLDIDDYSNAYALDMVKARYGEPLAVCASGSGGWHAWYPVKREHLHLIGAGQYLIDGKAIGETSCGQRWSVLWQPMAALKSLCEMLAIDDDDPRFVCEDDFDRGKQAPSVQPPRAPAKPLAHGDGITAQQIIDHYGLEYKDTHPDKGQEWYGACPVCAARCASSDSQHERNGGSTRFSIRAVDLDATTFSLRCWICCPSTRGEGGKWMFDDEEWQIIAKPIWDKQAATADHAGLNMAIKYASKARGNRRIGRGG